MTNDFRLEDGSLDRQYLRVCAVWHCLKYHGASWEWAERRLAERQINPNLISIWKRASKRRLEFDEDTTS